MDQTIFPFILSISSALGTLTGLALAFVVLRVVRRRREAAAKKAAEATAAEIAESLHRTIHGMAQRLGLKHIHECDLADIKFGDRAHWASDDMREQLEYTAGYDGDPGPSEGGHHGKEVKDLN